MTRSAIGDQTFKSAFADAMLERLDGSLLSPLSTGTTGTGQADPTSVLLFATTASDISRQVGRAVDVLIGLLSGRGGKHRHFAILLRFGVKSCLMCSWNTGSAAFGCSSTGSSAWEG